MLNYYFIQKPLYRNCTRRKDINDGAFYLEFISYVCFLFVILKVFFHRLKFYSSTCSPTAPTGRNLRRKPCKSETRNQRLAPSSKSACFNTVTKLYPSKNFFKETIFREEISRNGLA